MECNTPGFPVSHQFPEPIQTHVHQAGDAIQLFYPLSPSSPPALNLSQHQGLFQWKYIIVMTKSCWSRYWSFSFSISPSSEYSGLISFKIDWFDFLAVQSTLQSLLWQRNLKASVLLCSTFFIIQLSHPYMTIGKTIALTIWTFVSRVMSLLLTCYLGLSQLFSQEASIF